DTLHLNKTMEASSETKLGDLVALPAHAVRLVQKGILIAQRGFRGLIYLHGDRLDMLVDPRYLIRPYYLVPDGKVGHDAFAVIRETIRNMNKIAIGRVVLTNREHIIALEPLGKGLMGTLLRYPYEVRSETEYFDDIQDVKVTKDMLDLAKH